MGFGERDCREVQGMGGRQGASICGHKPIRDGERMLGILGPSVHRIDVDHMTVVAIKKIALEG